MNWWQDDLDDGRLGDYRLQTKLGEGGMAEVFRAVGVDGIHRGRVVAIKVPRIGAIAPDELDEYLKRFRREIDLQNAGAMPAHVATMLGAGEVDDRRGVRRPYLVMDYYGGGSLGSRLGGAPGQRQHRQSLAEVLEWLAPIARALDRLHGARPARLHRDVKPENILFDEAGDSFLSDFGVATTLPPLGSSLGLSATGLASPGSGGYQPPESLNGSKQPASDQFSLAVTVYEALSGRMPVDVTNTQAYWVALANWQPQSLFQRCPELPRAAADAVMRALSAKPADRFQSCSQFAKALAEAALASKQPPPRPPELPKPPTTPLIPPSHRRVVWPWLIACVATAGALAALVLRPSPSVTGTLVLDIQPSGAQVEVNGRTLTASEGPELDLPPGQVEVRASHPEHRESVVRVDILAGQRSLALLQLEPLQPPPTTGALVPEIQPPNAEVEVNGRVPTASEGRELELPPGHVKVRASDSEHRESAIQVRNVAGQRILATLQLEPVPPHLPPTGTLMREVTPVHAQVQLDGTPSPLANGRLTILPTPTDARVRILNIGPPYRPGMELRPGRYHIEVSADGYDTRRELVVLGSGELRHSVQLSAFASPPPAPPAANPRFGGFVWQDNGLLLDTQTGLLWTANGNDLGVSQNNANAYCQNRGMRLPRIDELKSIYDRPGTGTIQCSFFTSTRPCRISPLFDLGRRSHVWSSHRNSFSEGIYFDFSSGRRIATRSSIAQALCVRDGS